MATMGLAGFPVGCLLEPGRGIAVGGRAGAVGIMAARAGIEMAMTEAEALATVGTVGVDMLDPGTVDVDTLDVALLDVVRRADSAAGPVEVGFTAAGASTVAADFMEAAAGVRPSRLVE